MQSLQDVSQYTGLLLWVQFFLLNILLRDIVIHASIRQPIHPHPSWSTPIYIQVRPRVWQINHPVSSRIVEFNQGNTHLLFLLMPSYLVNISDQKQWVVVPPIQQRPIYMHWSPTVPVSVWLPEPVRDRGSKQKTLNDDCYHTTCRRDIWCTNSSVISCFNPRFVDRSVPYEAKQRRVKFRRCFGTIPLAAGNVSVTNIGSSGTEPKAPVTDYRNRANHTRG